MMALSVFAVSCSQTGTKPKTGDQTAATPDKEVDLSNVTFSKDLSRVVWFGEMLGLYSHEGTVDLAQADLKIQDGKIAGGVFVVDMLTITPTDQNYKPEEGSTPEKLVAHLSNADFFDVPNHPAARFEITRMDQNTAEGILTIRGVSKQETIENIAVSKEDNLVTIKGELVFDRKAFNVAWDHPIKDRVLSSDIKISIQLVGEKV